MPSTCRDDFHDSQLLVLAFASVTTTSTTTITTITITTITTHLISQFEDRTGDPFPRIIHPHVNMAKLLDCLMIEKDEWF